MGRGKQRYARKKRLEKAEKQEEEAERQQEQEKGRRLYICTCESSEQCIYRYRVLPIRLCDLYQFSSVPIPGEKYQVDSLEGDDAPAQMRFGAIGSRIVLLGGCWFKQRPTPTFVLDTNKLKPKFISSSSTSSTTMIPDVLRDRRHPWLPELNGKLYALSSPFSGDPSFDELEPEDSEYEAGWCPLPRLPFRRDGWDTKGFRSSTCAVLGTKIFDTLPMRKMTPYVKILCFDVAQPEVQWTEHLLLCSDPDHVCAFPGIYNKVLVLDLEGKEKEKLMFSFAFEYNLIRVFSMKLSDEGRPESIKEVDTIQLPSAIYASSYSCAHLGGRKVCFILTSSSRIQVFTFKFFYSPFSVKHLGSLLFDFKHKKGDRFSLGRLGGCFVLNSITPCQDTNQDPAVNEGDKV